MQNLEFRDQIVPRCLLWLLEESMKAMEFILTTKIQVQVKSLLQVPGERKSSANVTVRRSIKEMKALNQTKIEEENLERSSALAIVPISVIYPVADDTSPNQTPKRRGRKTTTRIIGEFFVSYELPKICVENNINLDSATLYKEQLGDVNNCRQYSIAERLEDWSLQQRERSNGMRDVYYYHTRSSSSFRSATEVVNFIVFELYPKPRTKTDNVAEADTSEIHIASSSNEKKKKCHQGQDGKKKQMKKDKAMDSSATHSGSSTKKEETKWKGRDNEMKQVVIDKTTVINFFKEYSRFSKFD